MSSNNFTFKSGRVDFSPVQTLTAGKAPNFFPPRLARAGSVGDAHYSPLVRVANRNDIVFNAPMIAFNVGPEKISFCGGNPDYSVVTDSVANICPDNGTVDLKLRFGFADGKHLRYLSFDANSEESAALEASTFAPAESDILQSGATEIIYTIVNGKTGRTTLSAKGSTARSVAKALHSTSLRSSRRSVPDIHRCGMFSWPSGPKRLSKRINENLSLTVTTLQPRAKQACW